MNISSTYYNQKPKGNEIAKIQFKQMTVTNDLLSSFISGGYCYCPTDRKLESVRESDYICIDVDDSTVEMNDYVSTLTDKPTIYYTTPSVCLDFGLPLFLPSLPGTTSLYSSGRE